MPNNSQQILTEPENKLPEFTFDDLPPVMRTSIDAMGWRAPMPVQATAVPYLLANRDMIVQSRTGSGKTGAFLIPLLMRIDPDRHHPQALVLVPTRELAVQVYSEFQVLGQGMGLEGALIYGGVGYNAQLQALRSGAQIIIGTPGRVLDHIGRRSLNLDRLNIIVFDEADEMLSMGFYPDMRELRRYLPRDRSSWMFSATMPYKVQLLAREFLKEPEFLSLSSGDVTVSTMEHRFYDVPPLEKDIMLMRLIELENPDSVIIFCNTKMEVEYVATVLRNYGYNADQLSGDLDQKSRERAMARIRNGETRFLVATDVAARGIDISDLSHVIQYDVPKDPDSYIHRAGRTARAGNTGVVITFISNMSEKSDLKKIARRYNIEFVELPAPTADEVSQRMGERLTIVLEDRFRTGITRMERERMKRFLVLAKNLAESDDESMLLAMLLDSLYHETFHFAPVPAPDIQTPAPAPVRAEQQAPRPQQAQAAAPQRPQAEQATAPDAAGSDAERRKKKRKRKKKRNRGGAEEHSGDSVAMEGQAAPSGQPATAERKEDARTDEGRRTETRTDEPRKDEGRREEVRRDESRREEVRRDEERKGEVRKDEGRREEGRRDGGRRDEERKSEPRKDEGRRDESRRDEGRREEERKGEARRDEGRREEERKSEPRKDEGRREEGRRDGGRRDEGRRDDRRRDQAPASRDDRRGGSGRSIVEAGDGPWLDSIQVIEPENFVEPERSVKPGAAGEKKGGRKEREAAPDNRGERRDAPAAEKAPKEIAPAPKETVKEKASAEPAAKESISVEPASKKTAKKAPAKMQEAASPESPAVTAETPASAKKAAKGTAPAEETPAPKAKRVSSTKKAAASAEETAPAKPASKTAKKAVAGTAPAEETPAPKAKRASSTKKAAASASEPAVEPKAASRKASSTKKAEGEAAPAKRRAGK